MRGYRRERYGNPVTERLPRPVWVLAAIAFFVALGFGVVVPVLPVYARTFGVSSFLIGVVTSSFALVRVLFTPVAARLNRRFAERLLLVAGVWIVGISSAATGLAQSYPQLLIARAAGGTGSAMFTIAGLSLLLSITPASMYGRGSGVFGGGFLLGGMAGPAVGGLLTEVSLAMPFFFYAGTLAVAGAVALAMLPRSGRTIDPSAPDPAVTFRRAWGDARYRAAVASSFAHGWQSNGVRSLVVPLLVVEVLAKPPSWTGIAFALAATVQGATLYASGWLADRIGRRPVLVVGSVVTAVLGVFLAWAGSYVLLVLVLCGYGIGASLCSTSSQASLGDAGARSGGALAGYQMAGDLGSIVGPMAAGLLLDRGSGFEAMAPGAVLLAASAVLALFMPKGPRRSERSGQG